MPTPDVIAGQYDFPNPVGLRRPQPIVPPPRTLINATTFYGPPGLAPTFDWPNPRGCAYPIELRSWLRPVNLSLLGQDRFPPGLPNLHDWPVPGRASAKVALGAFADNLQMPLAERGGGTAPVGNIRGNRYWPDRFARRYASTLSDPGYYPAVNITPVIPPPPPPPPPVPPTIVQDAFGAAQAAIPAAFNGPAAREGADPILAPSGQRLLLTNRGGQPVVATAGSASTGVMLTINLAPFLGPTIMITAAFLTLMEENGVDAAPGARLFGSVTVISAGARRGQAVRQILSGLVSGGLYVATLVVRLTDGSMQTYVVPFTAADPLL